MTREDFISWLDRPLTDTDKKIIDMLVDMIDNYDKNVKTIEELLERISILEKDLDRDIEVLEIE